MRPTAQLARTPLWQRRTETLPGAERSKISYERVKSVVKAYNLTGADVLNLSPRYWEFHTDPILSMDGAAGTLLTIHFNLCGGTLAMFAHDRPDVNETLQKLLRYDLSGQYLLTELGHGLDVINMETTATLLPNGDFELNTPNKRAAKFMPPTSPCGTPVVAIVFARLIVNGEARGVKPFVVHLSDGNRMNKGIVCQVLSPRGGSRPVRHALTYFQKVHLPKSALLGNTEKAKDQRAAFFYNVSRVITGTLSLGSMGLGVMKIVSYTAGKYSFRREVIDAATGRPRAIVTFSTQYTPILVGISNIFVMEAFANSSREMFVAAKANPGLRHFLAAVFKTTISRFSQATCLSLADRCGAQGLFEVNHMFALHADLKGIQIAEGDVLVTSVRFAMELLLGRITAPQTTNPDSVLAKHEASVFNELRSQLASAAHHRDASVEAAFLPHAQPLIEAVGHRMAYDAAVKAKVDPRILDLFVATVVKLDPAWYSENAGISRAEQAKMETQAAAVLVPDLNRLLDSLEVEPYVTAPIISDKRWDSYVNTLETLGQFEGELRSDMASVETRL